MAGNGKQDPEGSATPNPWPSWAAQGWPVSRGPGLLRSPNALPGPTVQCSKLHYTRTVPIVMCNMDVFHQVHFPVHTLTPNLTGYMVQVT